MGRSIVLFAVIWSIAGAIYTLYLRRYRRSALEQTSFVLGTPAPNNSDASPGLTTVD